VSVEAKRGAKRAAFWGGVAIVSVLANFGVELLADKFPNTGLRQLVAYTHKGRA